jgi:hypothetical protein
MMYQYQYPNALYLISKQSFLLLRIRMYATTPFSVCLDNECQAAMGNGGKTKNKFQHVSILILGSKGSYNFTLRT